MGQSVSRVNCTDPFNLGKQADFYRRCKFRVLHKIDKASIGHPSDFRHQQHFGTNTFLSNTPDTHHSRVSSEVEETAIDYNQFMQTLSEITRALEQSKPSLVDSMTRSVTTKMQSPSQAFLHLLRTSHTSHEFHSAYPKDKILLENTPPCTRSYKTYPTKDTKHLIEEPKLSDSMDELLHGNMTFNHRLESKIEAQIEKRACTRLRNAKLAEINAQKRSSSFDY
ncbi:hypothetical protein BDF14DRAFT_1831634 [Spinellus fusiger]|nr:hypothetical protein BDF14DRAFT_1831634 [Spinellus fusiger]